MMNALIMPAWIIAGIVSAIAIIFSTGIIPFIVPGAIVGIVGGVVHMFTRHQTVRCAWWVSGILIVLLAMTVTLLLIPDTRHWVIMRLVLAYYCCIALIGCFIGFFVEKFQISEASDN